MLTQLTKNVKKGQVRVKIKTTHGDMSFKLFEKDIPKAVENFLTHAKNGYYNGVIFHRVIKDFMIQGEIQLEQVWEENQFGDIVSKMNSQWIISTSMVH